MASNNTASHSALYSVESLFSGQIALVIPDMQRDYCWGLPSPEYANALATDSHKAASLVRNLIRIYQDHRPHTLGLLYGYELPPGSGRIHIIDGQQRITTIYLLLGMLYRRVPSDRLRQLIISDYELLDNREPRLLYQARREAFYFMSDLVTNFFLNRDGRLSQLEHSPWYFASYDSDLSVRNFIGAIRQIDQALEEAALLPDWDFDDFAQFIIESVKFLYFDLGDRSEAEKMFITINTTGEPLTLAQKLRSYSFAIDPGDRRLPHIWNEMEDWMWMHRKVCDFDAFVSWHLSSLPALQDYQTGPLYEKFRLYKRLVEAVGLDSEVPGINPYQHPFMLRTMLTYLERFGTKASDADIRRLWHMLCNILRYQRLTSSSQDYDDACKMVLEMPTPDVLSLLYLRHAPAKIMSDEERAKLAFIAKNQTMRHEIERAFARAEAHPVLNGRIAKVLAWCHKCKNPEQALKLFEHYSDMIYKIFGTEIDRQPRLDTLRRALLSLKHPEYPIARRGNSALSLCWNDYDWQRLMQQSPGVVRQLIDRIDSMHDGAVNAAFNDMIGRFSDKYHPYYFIIKQKEVLRNCRKRQLIRPAADTVGFYDWQENRTRWWRNQKEIIQPIKK